jgi:histidyl-tRNA synthetase
MSGEAERFFVAVCDGLDAAGVKWERAPTLVRGLDYYRHTAFEFVTDRLGAQGTVLGGGRYDGLIETLGGDHTPAVGWAAGIERLAMLTEERGELTLQVAVVVEDDDLLMHGILAARSLRDLGFVTDVVSIGSPRKRYDKAVKSGAETILSLSLENGEVMPRLKATDATRQKIEQSILPLLLNMTKKR